MRQSSSIAVTLTLALALAAGACGSKKKDEPPAPPVIVKPDQLVRTAGVAAIQPDADTAKTMVSSGRTRVLTSWKVCVDAHGAVDEVAPIRSSGFVTWDAALAAGIRAWRFQPYAPAGGAPVRACTSYTFSWSAS